MRVMFRDVPAQMRLRTARPFSRYVSQPLFITPHFGVTILDDCKLRRFATGEEFVVELTDEATFEVIYSTDDGIMFFEAELLAMINGGVLTEIV